jgi:hypothetical protein
MEGGGGRGPESLSLQDGGGAGTTESKIAFTVRCKCAYTITCCMPASVDKLTCMHAYLITCICLCACILTYVTKETPQNWAGGEDTETQCFFDGKNSSFEIS